MKGELVGAGRKNEGRRAMEVRSIRGGKVGEEGKVG